MAARLGLGGKWLSPQGEGKKRTSPGQDPSLVIAGEKDSGRLTEFTASCSCVSRSAMADRSGAGQGVSLLPVGGAGRWPPSGGPGHARPLPAGRRLHSPGQVRCEASCFAATGVREQLCWGRRGTATRRDRYWDKWEESAATRDIGILISFRNAFPCSDFHKLAEGRAVNERRGGLAGRGRLWQWIWATPRLRVYSPERSSALRSRSRPTASFYVLSGSAIRASCLEKASKKGDGAKAF